MPKDPDGEGSPRLMTVTEIAEEHGVSRQSIHTYRRRGVFPQPVTGEGSTRPRFRADEVADFFAANPKQPGKRTDRPGPESTTASGEPVIEGQKGSQALNGNDARAVLGIVWKWIENANDGLGSDIGDLIRELEQAGYAPPADE